jgi:hypothetical protein
MTIGAALLLIAAGAVLRFAITTSATHGIDIHTIGDILMIVGVVGLILWLVIWLPRNRSRRAVYEPPADVPPRPRDQYRPDGRYPEGRPQGDGYPTEVYPEDQYRR